MGIIVSIMPSIRLPNPTMGNTGRVTVSLRPSASYTSMSDFLPRATKYVAHENTHDTKNNTPMAIVIHSTVCSRYLTSNAPTAIAHSARSKELAKVFIIPTNIYIIIYMNNKGCVFFDLLTVLSLIGIFPMCLGKILLLCCYVLLTLQV